MRRRILYENDNYFMIQNEINSFKGQPTPFVLKNYKIAGREILFDEDELKYIGNIDERYGSDLFIIYKQDKLDFSHISWLFYLNQTKFDVDNKLVYLIRNFYDENKIVFSLNEKYDRNISQNMLLERQVKSFFREINNNQEWNYIILNIDTYLKSLFNYSYMLNLLLDEFKLLSETYPYRLFGKLVLELIELQNIVDLKKILSQAVEMILRKPKVFSTEFLESCAVYFGENEYFLTSLAYILFDHNNIVKDEIEYKKIKQKYIGIIV